MTRLVSRRTWQPLAHLAQELRDERTERKAVLAEVKRLRQQGVPALAPADVPEDADYLALRGLRDKDGRAVPCEQWPAVAGAAVVVEAQWFTAEDKDGNADEDEHEDEDGHADHAFTKAGGPGVVAESDGSVLRLSHVWICTDPAAAGLHYPRWSPYTATSPRVANEPVLEDDTEAAASAEAAREAAEAEAAAREERRRVLVNNKAWRSSTTVRRDWLRQFTARKAAPSGAEALIAAAVIGCQPSLGQAFTSRHWLLRQWRPVAADDPHPGWDSSACQRLTDTAKTPKTTTMLTLAAVLAAWEDAATEWTWRKPSAWDGTVMHALTSWGYQASEVERLLIEPDADQETDDTDSDDSDDSDDTGYGDADGTDSDGVTDEEADEPEGDDVHAKADTDTADAFARVPAAE